MLDLATRPFLWLAIIFLEALAGEWLGEWLRAVLAVAL